MSPDEGIPPSRGRSAVTWQEGWPAAQLDGLTTVRLMVLPGPFGLPEDPQAWQLTAEPQPDGALQIIGEMVRSCGGFFLSAAAIASVRFANGQTPPMSTDEELDVVLLRYGPWVSHPLWDYCRVVLLQATVGFPLRPTLEIPVATPTPLCVTREMQRRRNEEDPGC